MLNREPAGNSKSGAVASLWNSTNLTDRLLLGWYLALSTALVAMLDSSNLIQHAVVIAWILLISALSSRNKAWRFVHDWYPLFVFIAAFEEVSHLSLAFVPIWQDQFLLRLEAAIFFTPPSIWLSRAHNFWLVEILEFGYFTFYWIMPAVGGAIYASVWSANSGKDANNPHLPFRIWMDATVVGYIVCYLIYLLFPTEGPAHTLARPVAQALPIGPFHWLVLFIQRHGGVHGNAFPSGHIMASVVALLAATRWKPKFAMWLVIPVLLMCVGAVYDGYHYFSDIIGGALIGGIAFWAVASVRRANPARVA